MTLFAAAFLFPGVLALLSLGVGLLADRASGSWIPGPIIPVVGAAGLIGLGQLTTTFAVSAPLTGLAFVLAAGCGYGLKAGRLRALIRKLRSDPWVALAVLAAYFIAIAPILLAGRPSLANYLTDTTTGTHLAGADWLIRNGRDFTDLSQSSSYGLQVRAYFEASNYPSGGHVLMAAAGQLVPVRLTWLFQPYMAFAVALVAPSAWLLLRRLGLASPIAALLAAVTSVPALVYALALTGSIKEITALSLILVLGVLTAEHHRWIGGSPNRAIPIGLVAGAGMSSVGVPFAAWTAVTAVVLVAAALRHHKRARGEWARLAWLACVGIAVAVITAPALVANYSRSAASATGIAETADPGNLFQPLNPLQAVGIWITGQYRQEPAQHIELTYALIGIALFCVPLGIAALLKSRNWAVALWVSMLGLLWWRLALRGTTWTDGKLILLSSPIVVLIISAAVAYLLQQRQRLMALAVGVVIAFGVLSSDAQQYRDTNLAPTSRFDELAAINERFADRGPTFATDFDEFALYELRDVEVSAPGFAYRPDSVASAGVAYGESVDIDSVPESALRGQRLIVQRRGPAASRPPSNFVLRWRGVFYDVWERDETSRLVLGRLASSGPLSAESIQPCEDVRALAREADAAGGQLIVASRQPSRQVVAGRTSHSLSWGSADTLGLFTTGRLDTTLNIRQAGDYEIWLQGQIGRKLEVQVDGRKVGRVGEQSAGMNNFLTPVTASLSSGKHRFSVVRRGGSLRPGDTAPSTLQGLVVSPADNDSQVRSVAPAAYQTLCGRQTDWIEATP